MISLLFLFILPISPLFPYVLASFCFSTPCLVRCETSADTKNSSASMTGDRGHQRLVQYLPKDRHLPFPSRFAVVNAYFHWCTD